MLHVALSSYVSLLDEFKGPYYSDVDLEVRSYGSSAVQLTFYTSHSQPSVFVVDSQSLTDAIKLVGSCDGSVDLIVND